MALLVAGNAAPSIIALVTLPIISRLFEPDAVGAWAIFQSLLFVPGILATLRYELAVLVAQDEDDAGGVTVFVLALCISLSIAATLVVIGLDSLGMFPLGSIFNVTAATCLAASFAGTGLFNLGLAIANRKGAFQTLLKARVLYSATVAGVSIGVGFWWPSADALIIGTTLGFFVGATPLFGGIWTYTHRFGFGRHNWCRVVQAIRDNRAFAYFTAPYTVVTQFFGFAVPALISLFHGVHVVGQYSVMLRTLHAPASIAITSLGQYVVRPLVGYADNRTEAAVPLASIVVVLIALAVPIGTLGTSVGEEVFIFIFGAQWRVAGQFAEYAALPMCLYLSISWIDRLFDAWHEQRLGFIIGTTGCTLWLGALLVGQMLGGTPSALIAGWSIGLGMNAVVWGLGLARLGKWPLPMFVLLLQMLAIGILPTLAVAHFTNALSMETKILALGVTLAATYGMLWKVLSSKRLDLRLFAQERRTADGFSTDRKPR